MAHPYELKNKLHCKQGAVRNIRFNVDGDYCLSSGGDKSVKLWNPHTSKLLQTYMGHGFEVLDAVGSCDNAYIASAGMDKCVFYWDVTTAQIVRRFRGHAGCVNSVEFNEESTLVLSASVDNTVFIWDCRSKNRDPVQVLRHAKDSVTSLSISNHEILTASLDCVVRRYDLRMGKLLEDNLGCSVTNVRFTKDGQCVLASCLDSTLRLLDKDSGEILAEYTSHRNENYLIKSCLSHTDTEVISGSEDGFVYFWDLIEYSVKEKLKHEGAKVVHSVSFHPSKAMLLTAAESNVFLWTSAEVSKCAE